MSPWFRASQDANSEDDKLSASVTGFGVDRLLTPAELQAKSQAILGWTWGEWDAPYLYNGKGSNLIDRFGSYYGGIDSVGIKERALALTSLMVNVAERQAISMACPAVVVDFDRPDETRLMFSGIAASITPATEFTGSFEVSAASYESRTSYTLIGQLDSSAKTIRLSFDNDYYGDGNDRNLRLDRVRVRSSSGVVRLNQELELIETQLDCGGPAGLDFNMWGNCSLDIPYKPAKNDSYEIEVVAWGEQAGPEAPRLTISINDNEPDAGISRGALEIKSKLIDLHQKLLGESLEPGSEELLASYQFLVETWQARLEKPDNQWAASWPDESCDWYLEEQYAEGGVSDRSGDPSGMLNTWASVLIYLMTDFEYLHE